MPSAPTETDQKLAADVAALRAELSHEFTGLAEFKGAVRNDLRRIKGIRATLLLAALSFAGWIIADQASLGTQVKGLDRRVDEVKERLDRFESKIEARFDRLEKKLDAVIERTAPKAP